MSHMNKNRQRAIKKSKRRNRINNILFVESFKKTAFLFLCMFIVIFFVSIFWSESIEIIISSFLGITLSILSASFITALGYVNEDSRKINLNLYNYYEDPEANNYNHTIISGNKDYYFIYRPRLCMNEYPKGIRIIINDNKDSYFMLDEVISNYYTYLLRAHRNSSIRNDTTVRLKSMEINKIENQDTLILNLERSTFYNHLVTNRAVDYRIESIVNLREVYEYGPKLNDFCDSSFSNHIGINAIVFLKDGTVPLPVRKGNSTISKKMFTSSIAVRLKLPKNEERTKVIKDEKDFLELAILNSLSDRLHFDLNWVKTSYNKDEIEISFLGFGQDVYEGGKPQFYYAVFVNNMDSKEYINLLKEDYPHLVGYLKDQSDIDSEKRRITLLKRKEFEQKNFLKSCPKIDVDESIYVCKKAEISDFIEGKMELLYICDRGIKKLYKKPEKSFYCNLWHLLKCKDILPKSINIFDNIKIKD